MIKNIALVVGLVVTFAGVTGCHKWENNVTCDGIVFAKYREPTRSSDTNNTVRIGLLKHEAEMNGLTYTNS